MLLRLKLHLRAVHKTKNMFCRIRRRKLRIGAEVDGDSRGERDGGEGDGRAEVCGCGVRLGVFVIHKDMEGFGQGEGGKGDCPVSLLREEVRGAGDRADDCGAGFLIEYDGRSSPLDVFNPIARAVIFIEIEFPICADDDLDVEFLRIWPAIGRFLGGVEGDDGAFPAEHGVGFQCTVEPLFAVAVVNDTGEYIDMAARGQPSACAGSAGDFIAGRCHGHDEEF